MMQSCASAGEAPGGGPILSVGHHVPCSNTAFPPPGIVNLACPPKSQRVRRVGKGMLFRAFTLPERRNDPSNVRSGDKAPERQLTSLRASANDHCLKEGDPRRPS